MSEEKKVYCCMKCGFMLFCIELPKKCKNCGEKFSKKTLIKFEGWSEK